MTQKSHDAALRVALFPGSFNPFTLGHKSVVDRVLPLFDRVVIAVGYNEAKGGDGAGADDRAEAIRRVYRDNSSVEVITYSGLTVDACRRCDARFMVRGVRSVADFEYERSLADINRDIAGIETLLLYTLPCYASVSSSAVRELSRYGCDVSRYLPPEILTKK